MENGISALLIHKQVPNANSVKEVHFKVINGTPEIWSKVLLRVYLLTKLNKTRSISKTLSEILQM